ncbi:MAG: GNAT family N-acetyltransferase [Mycobacteriales bacterium]
MPHLDVPLSTRLPGDVRLRDLTETDAARFAAHVASDLARLSQFLAWPERTATAEGALGFIQPYLDQNDGRRVIAGIWADGELVGGIVLFHHDPVTAVVELGCWAVAAAEGTGAVRAACVEGLRLARAWDVERVQWHCDPRNARSAALARRLGFVYEGMLRSSYPLRGSRCDTAVYGLVEGEIDEAIR